MRIEELTDEAVDYIVAHMDKDYLTKWESDFFASVSKDWKLRRDMSPGRRLKLGEIWDRQP